jgi:hypothetical protein
MEEFLLFHEKDVKCSGMKLISEFDTFSFYHPVTHRLIEILNNFFINVNPSHVTNETSRHEGKWEQGSTCFSLILYLETRWWRALNSRAGLLKPLNSPRPCVL